MMIFAQLKNPFETHFYVKLAAFLSRKTRPYRRKIIGKGSIAKVKNPKRELPQPYPRALYMYGPAKGNRAPKSDRVTVIAAIPEAAYRGYESIT